MFNYPIPPPCYVAEGLACERGVLAGEDDAGKPSSATPSLCCRAAPAPSQLEGTGPTVSTPELGGRGV